LGRSISLKLAQLGCNLVIVEKNLSAIKDVAHEAKCIGVKAEAFEANVERLDEVQRLEEFLSAQEVDVNYLVSDFVKCACVKKLVKILLTCSF
jgi:short-subunit dehydrogenase